MVQRWSDIDWYSVFLSYFSHEGAVDASSDSPALAPHAPESLGGHQRSEELWNEFERRFGERNTSAQVNDGANFRITRLAAKVCMPASWLLSSCNENELWCLNFFCALSVPQLCAYCVGFVRSLYELHPIGYYSEYHFWLGLQDVVGLGPDVDVPSASKGVCDFSKISTLAVVTILNLAHLQMVKGGLGDGNAISLKFGLC
jgi:hypothetical protein